jgi:hypothetical protein
VDGFSAAGRGNAVFWEISEPVTRGSLASPTRRGLRPVAAVSSFHGSFYLRPNGHLAGFAIHLGLRPDRVSGVAHKKRADRVVFWEAVDLHHLTDRDFTGTCVLQTTNRTFRTRTHGKIITAAAPGHDLPYWRITLAADFRGIQLGWPPSARYLFRRVEMRFFTEIHQHWAA